MKLSKNFALHEFTRSEAAARKGIDNTPSQEIIDNLALPFDQLIYEFGEWTHASVPARGAKARRQVLTIDSKGTRVGLHEIRR